MCHGHTIIGMLTLLSAVGSLLSFRVRSCLTLELELVALRHRLTVLRRQLPGRPRLFSADRLLWVWLCRIWPQVLDAMVLVKPVTDLQWHRKGFRLYRRRSRHLGRPSMNREVRDLTRQMARQTRFGALPASTASASSSASRSARPRLADTCRGGPRSPPRPGARSCTTTCLRPPPSTCSLS